MKDQVKAFKAPSPIIILVCVIVFCAIASYIIPAGVYDRVKDVQTGKMVVDPSTFHYVAQKPTGFLDFFTSINKGFKGGISIIAFLFMVGGSLNILAKTGIDQSFFQRSCRRLVPSWQGSVLSSKS